MGRTTRMIAALAIVALVASTGCENTRSSAAQRPSTATASTPAPGPPAQTVQSPPPPPPITYPVKGTGQWSVATGTGPVVGHAGGLWRYRVAVEGGIDGVIANEFATAVARTLGDPRGWTATGRFRLQQVGPAEPE